MPTNCVVLNKEGKENGNVSLPEAVFDSHVNSGVLHQAIVMYQASLRSGLASTKERGSVRGGGKKPWRQKGTGRARAGSTRSPLWHKGGVVFGPHPRDFGYSVPRKIKKVALAESLNAKYQKKELVCIEDLKESFNKTKDFSQVLKNLNVRGRILAVLDGSDLSVERVSRNIARLTFMRAADVNAYDILKNKFLLVSKTGLKNLLDRLGI